MAFQFDFKQRHPKTMEEASARKQGWLPPVEGDIALAQQKVAQIGAIAKLPPPNQQVIAEMVRVMMEVCNDSIGAFDGPQFWALYLIGSRANGTNKPRSDVDLLSVGTYSDNLRFPGWSMFSKGKPFNGFSTNEPEELPDEYNVGQVDAKYLVRATPNTDLPAGTLPIDLNVVDLTFRSPRSLDGFKAADTGTNGELLTRTPLVELTAAGFDWQKEYREQAEGF